MPIIPERPVPVHLSPRPLRAAWRLALSHRATDTRPLYAAVSAAFWPAVTGGGLLLALLVNVLLSGHFVGWDGLHAIPTSGK